MTGDDIKDLIRRHPIVSGCVGLSILILAWLFVLRTDPIPGYKKEISALEREMNFINFNKANGSTLKKDVDSIQGVVKDIDGKLMSAKDTTENLSYFFSLESPTKTKITDPVQLDVVSFKDKDVNASFKSRLDNKPVYIGYEFDVTGDFPGVLAYLSALRSGHYFVRVSYLSLKPTRNGNAVFMNLNFQVFGKEK